MPKLVDPYPTTEPLDEVPGPEPTHWITANETLDLDFAQTAAELARQWEAMTPKEQEAALQAIGAITEAVTPLIDLLMRLPLSPMEQLTITMTHMAEDARRRKS